MTEHAGAVHWRVRTLQARQRGCQHTMFRANKASGLHLRPERGGTGPSRSHLVPPPLGGQVGQTAAGHRSELLPASLAVALLAPPSFTEPGEEQARRHGGDRARRGDFSWPVRQLAVGASSGRNPGDMDDFLFENDSKKCRFGLCWSCLCLIRPVAY